MHKYEQNCMVNGGELLTSFVFQTGGVHGWPEEMTYRFYVHPKTKVVYGFGYIVETDPYVELLLREFTLAGHEFTAIQMLATMNPDPPDNDEDPFEPTASTDVWTPLTSVSMTKSFGESNPFENDDYIDDEDLF